MLVPDDFGRMFMSLVGFAFLLSGPYMVWDRRRKLARRTGRATGRVTGNDIQHSNHSESHSVTYHPIVCFVAQGREWTFTSDTGVSWKSFVPGDHVEVAYNPSKPQDAHIVSDRFDLVNNVLAVLLPVVGLGILVFGAG